MPTWLSVLVTVALAALCLYSTRLGPGWKAWPLADRINYVVLCLTVWPYLLVGFLTAPPRWYSITAGVLFAATMVVFLARQVQFLREGRTALRHAREQLARQAPPE